MPRPPFDALLTETIVIRRPMEGGEYVRGHYRPNPNAEDVLTLRASVQPAGGEALDNNPENERTREMIAIWLAEEIYTATSSPLLRPDVVEYDGKKFEVTIVEKWRGLMPHYKAMAERLEIEE